MIEKRYIRTNDLQFDAEPTRLSGYAAKFNILSHTLSGNFRELIHPGVTDLAAQDTIATIDHDPARFLGRTSSKTLRLSEDYIGLRFLFDLPYTTLAHDLGHTRGQVRVRPHFSLPRSGRIKGTEAN